MTYKKYIIGTIGRTGSTLYARLLNEFMASINGHQDNISFSNYCDTPDWTKPIQHTHQKSVFKEASPEYIRIIPTRSILESEISAMIALVTDCWHINNHMNRLEYQRQFSNSQFTIDLELFSLRVTGADKSYTEILDFYKNIDGEKYLMDYDTYATDYHKFFTCLNLDYSPGADVKTHNRPLPMPLDKFLLVENLQEVLDTYKEIDVVNDFNDIDTINHIENILKEQK